MRLLLAIALVLLFVWLHKAQMSNDTLHGNPCEAVSMSKAAVSFLLSPLSLYSWLASMLVRLVLSAPALLLSSLHNSLLLLLAWPWCIATVSVSLLLTCFHIGLYLLHLALVVAVVAILTLMQHKIGDGDTTIDKVPHQQKKLERRNTQTRLFGRRVEQQV